MELSKKEKQILGYFLDQLMDRMACASCNDLPPEIVQCLTPDEWDLVDKEFHASNGDPQEHVPGRPNMQDTTLLSYLRHKIDL